MRHMRIWQMVEDVVEDSIVTVNSAQCSLNPRPSIIIVVRNFGVCMLEVRDSHEPSVVHQVGNAIEKDEPGVAINIRGQVVKETNPYQ